MAQVSVIIVNHNGRADLADVLNSLARQVRPADEVIVVDNASSDGSVEFVRTGVPLGERGLSGEKRRFP